MVPLTLLLILILLYTAFNSLREALMIMATVPFALIGGVFSLILTGTAFSISAAVGVISTLGVTILGGVLLGIATLKHYAWYSRTPDPASLFPPRLRYVGHTTRPGKDISASAAPFAGRL